MGREILFKAKRIDNGEWITGYYFRANLHWHNHGIHEDWLITNAIQNGGWCNVCSKYAIDRNTLCQYTGLTDKNGNKIWENDVVKDNVVFGTVVWDEKYVQFMIDDEFDGHQDYSDWWGEVEVIGNIFDVPELMKEE